MTMSVITLDMIESFALKHGTDLSDGSQIPGVIGTLVGWEAGRGEMDAFLVDHSDSQELFAPLRTAYFAALGKEAPPLSKVG